MAEPRPAGLGQADLEGLKRWRAAARHPYYKSIRAPNYPELPCRKASATAKRPWTC